MRCKQFILLLVLMMSSGEVLLADKGSGESSTGTLRSLPPEAPLLSAPGDGASGVSRPLEVVWQSADFTSSYTLQVSTASDFNSCLVDDGGLTDTTYTLSTLSEGQSYYWRVRGVNEAGAGDYSTVWDFATESSLPVTIYSFSAEPVQDGIILRWITQSEINNRGFILERAAGTVRVSPALQWNCIASYETHNALRGQGNSAQQSVYTFTDTDVNAGMNYVYRLSDVSTHGAVHIYDTIGTAIPDTPGETALRPPFPNPFNPKTRISYELAEAGAVEITVYDLLGRKIQTLVNENQSAGSYHVYWHGDDGGGRQVASGAYLLILKTCEGIRMQKVLMVR